MKRKELKERRTANTKVFENQDHSVTAQIYFEPVHYEKEDGAWEDMDNRLTEEGEEFSNEKGKLKIRFKKQAKEKDTISITKDGCRLDWGLEGAFKVKSQFPDEETVLYPEVCKDTDLRCRVFGEKVKDDLILKTKAAPEYFTFRYRMKGLVSSLVGNTVRFSTSEGEEVFCLSAPYMKDGEGRRSEKIALSLEEGKNKECLVTLTPDREWMEAPERVYPVVVDPVITTSKKREEIKDAHVDSAKETDHYPNSVILKTWGGDNIQRSFVKFKLPEIKSGDMIINARLVLVALKPEKPDNRERTISVHRVLQNWDTSTINWYNAPIYGDTVEDVCKFTVDQQKYITMDITRLVKDWYENGKNYGLMFKEYLELNHYTEYLSADCDKDYEDMRPRIDISYVNYSGLEDYWTYHSQSAGRAGVVHVNDYNGNLILTHATAEMGGSRMPVSLSQVYNTNDCNTNLGYGKGWRLSFHQTIKKVNIAGTDYYQHTEGDGTIHYFYHNTEKKKWMDESTEDLTLKLNPSSDIGYMIEDKENNQMIFDKTGFLTKIRDKNGNTTQIEHAENRITKVTECTGKRSFVFTYDRNSQGKMTHLKKIQTPSGTISLGYSGEDMIRITDIDKVEAEYSYDSSHRLTEVRNKTDNYKLRYSYSGTGAHRVRKIEEFAGETAGDSLSITYGYNSTKYVDGKEKTEIYRFNNSGNLLHVHDGFGHAASAKFNKQGNQVNRLENETKLQDNIVQLLRDPIMEEIKDSPWYSSVCAGNIVTAARNADAQHCEVGTHSLKLTSTKESGYGYWRQDVKVKKGETYTFSMYVKAEISALESVGKCFLRAQCYDKDGKSMQYDSEGIRRTTDGFLQLSVFFTVPKDAKNDTVNLYLHLYHVKGTLYGDVAQLETGNTANRCNLVENGSFHLGNTSGFTKIGTEEDALVKVDSSVDIPIQKGLHVITKGAVLRKSPDSAAASAASLAYGEHISGIYTVIGRDGKEWHRAAKESGVKGYVPASQAIPYVSGSEGVYNGAVAMNNGILYSKADAGSSRVQEGIPKGTRLCIKETSKDASGRKWYFAALSMDKSRYHGYIPEDTVIRLARNDASGKTNKSTKLYATPSRSGSVKATVGSGTSYTLRGEVYRKEGTFYAVLLGDEFVYIHKDDVTVSTAPEVVRLGKAKAPGQIPELDSHIYKFAGDPAMDKKLTKTLNISGKKGDNYMVNAWGKGTSLPETDNDKKRRFGVEVVFVGTDGKEDVHYTNFSPDILDWQFLSDVYAAEKDYTSIKVSYTYCHNANLAFFDGLSLFREEFGQTYTYDKEHNLTSVTDAQKKRAEFKYNENNDMTGMKDFRGNEFEYKYDDKHNVIQGTSAQNVVYKLEYDRAGNVVKSACVNPGNPVQGTWVTRTFTADDNHVASVTDAGGNVVKYTWDEARDLMKSMTDARGNTLSYAYDEADRLKSVSMKVGEGGSQTVENTYIYTKDKLTSIGHNGFSYGFAYDGFGNALNASIAGKKVVSYEYKPNNGNLLKVLYGNGDYLRYDYDRQDRISVTWFYSAAEKAEKKLYSYVYNKQGELARVTDQTLGKTYWLYYDFLGRLMRVVDMKDSCSYEYHYDAGNNMVSLRHSAEATFQTNYVYDKDSREQKVTTFGHTRTTHYDKYGRVTEQVWNEDAAGQHKTIYTYDDRGNNRYSLVKEIMVGGKSTFYKYDENGNIIQISEGTAGAEGKTSTFKYDKRNQLIREDNHLLNKTFAYAYDLGGNMTRMEEYAFTKADKALPSTPVKTIRGTFDSTWKDQLLTWNGVSMTYDAIGNMVKKGNTTYTWTQGRKLSTVNNGKKIQYFYDHTGRRVRKTVDGVITDFRMAGELLMSQKAGDVTTYFSYDSAGNLIGMSAGRERYFYTRNAQNDITGLIDENGTSVVQYQYDSWGKLLGITGSLASTIGKRNPFRYRGYYYDDETGMYYLQSRYYDPEIKRFICADDITTVQTLLNGLHNKNTFSYCDNNPICHEDTDGNLWIGACALIGGIAGGLFSIGSQMVFDKKSISDIDWVDVASSAISGAVATTSLNGLGQIIVNAALGAASSIIKGENLGNIVVNTAKRALSGYIGGKGGDFYNKYMKYDSTFEKIINSSMDISSKHMKIKNLRINYMDTVRKTTKETVEGYVKGYLVTNRMTYNDREYAMNSHGQWTALPAKYDSHRGYVPCHPQISPYANYLIM